MYGKVRTHYLIRGWSYAAVAGIGPVLAVLGEIPDTDHYIVAGIFTMVFGTISYIAFKRARKAGPDEQVHYAPPPGTPVEEQLTFYRRYLTLSLCAAPLAGAFTFWQLHPLHDGTAESVRTWAPLALLYDHFGFWPAVLSLPVLFVAFAAVFVRKIKRLRDGHDL